MNNDLADYISPTSQVPPNPDRQNDSAVIPVRHPRSDVYSSVAIDSNRLRGGAALDQAADRALTPDAGVVGFLARFLAVSTATTGLLSMLCINSVTVAIALVIAVPVLSVTGFALRRSSHHKAIAAAYLVAIALGVGAFTAPVAYRTFTSFSSNTTNN